MSRFDPFLFSADTVYQCLLMHWQMRSISFTTNNWISGDKFGPNFLEGSTPLTNLRLVTMLSGESEVKIIDPNLVEWHDSPKVRFIKKDWLKMFSTYKMEFSCGLIVDLVQEIYS